LSAMSSMISFGLNMSSSPPVGDDVSPQPQNEFSRVGFSRTGVGTEPAVEAAPKFVRLLQYSILGAKLSIANDLPWEMFMYERTDCRAGAAIETF
jgi:hypothetical protein